jgi:hypothetical protein
VTKPRKSKQPETATDIKIGARKRSSVIKDFEKAAGPLRGQNRDQKPKA